MRKIYISADIEGVCGIADWKETELTEAQGAPFRAQMTREVAAACEAAAEAGVDEILVKDAHGSGRSIDAALLPERVRLMRSWTRDIHVMMSGIDSSFDGAMFVGYHSGAGTNGNPLAHTMNTDAVEVLVNGEKASEFLINAYTAASFGVPILLLTGDRLICEEAARLNPRTGTVAVSEGIGNASVSINPRLAVERIRKAAAEALRGDPAACRLRLPERFELSIRFRAHHLAYRGSFYPGASQAGPNSVAFSARDWTEALRFMFFVL